MKAFDHKSVLSPKCVAVSVWKFISFSKMSLNKVRSSGSLVNHDDIVKCGHLKKLKTMKKKFFVLRRDTGRDSPARLEYYDTEKKFKSGAAPKKPIFLRSCFSINEKKDAKHNHVITLYTNQDSVSVAAESETEFKDWLGSLTSHMKEAVAETDDQSRKLYEHVWLVVVQPRSLGSSKSLIGEYRICLTYKSIAMVRVGDYHKKIEFPLNSIRRCGHTGSFFFLGLGRSAVTGAGDIWMLTEDAVIAENMHNIIRKAMHHPYDNMSEEPVRVRTQSMSHHRSFDGTTACHPRSRCGSMPSRSRTSSEGSVQTVPNKLPPPNCSHQMDGPGNFCLHPITRPKSMYSSSLSSCSPPFASALFSPSSSESVASTTSVDECDGPHSHTPDIHSSGICEEESYVSMGTNETGSLGINREHFQPSFTLPINTRSMIHHPLSKGLVSPVSGSSTDGPCLSSPQENYMDMDKASPSADRTSIGGILGSLSDREGYMLMDRTSSQGQGNVASENSCYLSMAPLNSPGSNLPSWPPHTSSQVSSPPHSANHSRIPSIIDDTTDSYLSMVPGGIVNELSCDLSSYRDREGYLDMTPTQAIPLPCSPSDGDSFPEMSPGSSCSFTSGTPSSDHRFPEYIAEKSGSGSYCGYSEDDDSSIERPIRTNSVGSKPEQFRSRKNRLEVSPAEPARVRAFSVGSRVGLRLAGGRTGYMAGSTGCAASAAITEFSPSIKEKGKQVKSKSTSAPILGTSPISNSWSGTPGTFFRGFLQNRSQERSDLMEFDFSKNKSCDSITGDKEKKSSSIESIRRTLTGQRHRSNSKSSGNGKSMFDSMKRDKKKSESESSGKGIEIPSRQNYFELDISPSPRRNMESNNGYLPMKPSISLSQSSTSEYLDMSNKDPINRQPFTDSYMDMSKSSDRIGSSPSTFAPHDGYVDMSQGKGIGPLTTPVSSSSSTTSNSSSSFIGARVRKISSTFMSSQDPCSQLDEYMPVDFRSNADSSSHSHDGEKAKKKEKKSTKRKSFKESTKRKKSEPIAVMGKGDEVTVQEGSRKGTSPLTHLSTLLGRKNSSGTPPKTPLSPTGSPLPKSSRGTPSPFSSLTRSKNRDGKDTSKDSVVKESSGVPSLGSGFGTSCIKESSREAEESAISGDSSVDAPAVSAQTVPNNVEQLGKSSHKRSSGVFESSQVTDAKLEERQVTLGSESVSHSLTTISQQQECISGDMGAYVNLVIGTGSSDKNLNLNVENKQRKVSTGSMSSDYMNISPISSSRLSESEVQPPPLSSHTPHDYVNMCPGGRRPEPAPLTTHLSPQSASNPSTASPSSKNSNAEKGDSKKSPSLGYSGPREQNRRESKRLSSGGSDDGEAESGYLLMTPGQPPPKPTSPRVVTRRPDIPPALLGGRPDPSLTANLERLNLGGPGGISVSERCRSHSGPGAPEGSAVGGEVRVKKQLSEPRGGSGGQGVTSGRAASACSSPVSYSPPTSPTLGGSVSSVSSLSEGGLSSASSTCTVVNVGVGRRESGLTAGGRVQDTQSDSTSSTSASSVSSSQQSSTTVSSGSSGDSGLNYVSLDLGPARCDGVMPSPRASRRTASGTSTHALGTVPQEPTVGEEDYSLSYAQIDFTKSEGLRTTSLSRDHRH